MSQKKQEYYWPEFDQYISEEELKNLSAESQIDVMSYWFGKHYEDPVQSTPYITAEGGYQYIWGGPYDASEELYEEFSGKVLDSSIDSLVEELEEISTDWSGRPGVEEYDDILYNLDVGIEEIYKSFHESVGKVEDILHEQIRDTNVLLRMLYANVITCLEAYLFDMFVSKIKSDEECKKRFVATFPYFQSRKIKLSEIFQKLDKLDNTIQDVIVGFAWHNLERVKSIYKSTLEVDIPDIAFLAEAVKKRHDIVHRNGKTKDGDEVVIERQELMDLIVSTHKFVNLIDAKLHGVEESVPFEMEGLGF